MQQAPHGLAQHFSMRSTLSLTQNWRKCAVDIPLPVGSKLLLGSDVFNLPDPRIVMATGLNSNSVGMQLVNSQLTMGGMDVDAVKSQLMTVVQNSQDHRIIDNITQLNAVVTSLDAFRQIRFLDSLQQQMIDSSY